MKNVLVVDDSATMRRMVISSLRGIAQIGFQEATNGLEAIERVAIGSIDLMILALNMPDRHGMEGVGFVRKHAPFSGVPIIVLPPRGDDQSRSAALAAGATRYMTKPFAPAALAVEA